MPDTDDAEQRLRDLEKTIDTAREHAEDAFPVLEDDEPRYVDSGTEHPEDDDQDDDQTATPG